MAMMPTVRCFARIMPSPSIFWLFTRAGRRKGRAGSIPQKGQNSVAHFVGELEKTLKIIAGFSNHRVDYRIDAIEVTEITGRADFKLIGQ